MRKLSIQVYFVNAVLKHTVRHGLDPIRLLREHRISPRLLNDADTLISIERFADLQTHTMLAMRDEALGYRPRRLPIGTWSMMCHAVIGSETLGQALSRYCRFFSLFESGLLPILRVDGEQTSMCLHPAETDFDHELYAAELQLSLCHRFLCWLARQQLPITALDLAYAQPAHASVYRQVFSGGPVHYKAPLSRMVITNKVLELPVVQNELSLRRFLRHPILAMLTQHFDRNSWTDRVRGLLRRDLTNIPELDQVAEHLKVHPQTLRRRLSAEGFTFTELKNQLRRDVALYYLGKHGLSIEKIAHRAGFSESSAFIRAFKGWTGVTPYTYRKGL